MALVFQFAAEVDNDAPSPEIVAVGVGAMFGPRADGALKRMGMRVYQAGEQGLVREPARLAQIARIFGKACDSTLIVREHGHAGFELAATVDKVGEPGSFRAHGAYRA